VHSHHETDPGRENQTRILVTTGPGLILAAMSAIEDLRHTIARLRGPGGCPWDQEQTHATLARCLIDECSELLDTIDRLDLPHMREELGDVLIQVIFHAQLAEEAGHFDLEDVAREVNEKLVRRHPHVFGAGRLETSDQVLIQWEEIKATEKKARPAQASLFKEQPPRLPALMYAENVWKQLGKKGLRAQSGLEEARVAALAEGLGPETLGRLLFELAAAAQSRELDPEGALRLYADGIKRHVEAGLPPPAA
jgi:MazG family protein